MQYVMSDIHGCYDEYVAMLEKIGFSPGDTLYILGDAVDRGPEPIKLLKDIARRDNVILLKGNHEAMAEYLLKKLNVEVTAENAETHIDHHLMQAVQEWMQNGGESTIREFRGLEAEEKLDILDFLEDTQLYDIVDIGEKTFILVHSGLGNFSEKKKLKEYSADELLNSRPDYEKQYFADPSVYIVSGHTPTLAVNGKAEIYSSHNNILIDCGAVFGGKLACLCLETLQEFYV